MRLHNASLALGKRGRLLALLVLAIGLMLATGSVGLAQGTPAAGSPVATGPKPTVAIGSKDFTEQILINEMLAQLLENAGYEVERKLNLGGTAVVHQALVSGEIDTYAEYTGTGLTAILNLPVQNDPQAVYDTVKAAYENELQLTWLDPLGFNNTYALAMTQAKATELGVTKISDLAAHAGDLTFGATQEFLTRPDGLPGLTEKYGFEFSDARGFDPGITYQTLADGQVDVISAFATDGRIPALDLVVLEDDLAFFPPYFAAPVVRQDLLSEDPGVQQVLNQLAGKIDDATMAGLNAQVDVDKMAEADVARAFLQAQGLVS